MEQEKPIDILFDKFKDLSFSFAKALSCEMKSARLVSMLSYDFCRSSLDSTDIVLNERVCIRLISPLQDCMAILGSLMSRAGIGLVKFHTTISMLLAAVLFIGSSEERYE